jgi:diphthamide synthase (EF-2-diphthine--ammonia ligase)
MDKDNIPTIEETLLNISIQLAELTGNAMGVSYLHTTSDGSFDENVATSVDQLTNKIQVLEETVGAIASELQELQTPLNSIAENLELIMIAYTNSVNNK